MRDSENMCGQIAADALNNEFCVRFTCIINSCVALCLGGTGRYAKYTKFLKCWETTRALY